MIPPIQISASDTRPFLIVIVELVREINRRLQELEKLIERVRQEAQ